MNSPKKILSLILLFIVFRGPKLAFSQPKIEIANVKEIMLIVKTGGFFTNYFRRIDIKREAGRWNCYQKQQYIAYDPKTRGPVNDTLVKLIKIVPERTLKKLARLINQRDPTIHLRLFKIDKGELLKDIDSMDFKIGPNMFVLDSTQHRQFEKMVRSKAIADTAAMEVLHPRRMDDEDQYSLRFITGADTTLVDAFSFVYPYYLPWHIGNGMSYDPRITTIFESLGDNKNFKKNQWISFHREIDRKIYFDYFSKRSKGKIIRTAP